MYGRVRAAVRQFTLNFQLAAENISRLDFSSLEVDDKTSHQESSTIPILKAPRSRARASRRRKLARARQEKVRRAERESERIASEVAFHIRLSEKTRLYNLRIVDIAGRLERILRARLRSPANRIFSKTLQDFERTGIMAGVDVFPKQLARERDLARRLAIEFTRGEAGDVQILLVNLLEFSNITKIQAIEVYGSERVSDKALLRPGECQNPQCVFEVSYKTDTRIEHYCRPRALVHPSAP
jgi:hypothetical protein